MHVHQKLSKDITSNYEHMDPGAFPDENTHNGPQNYER